ncbi:hypothetical protein SASPL_111366 [Salvia splendens]|uniref:Malic enzyme n=1 Tax=Salvia splendens TaxID=180675 RepID=A0A8X8YCC7_SALSN|nr:hypothetical protein SASPL_111366 [Salvia splendens]
MYTDPVSCPLPQMTVAAPADLHHDPSRSSLPVVVAIPPPPATISLSCYSNSGYDSMELIVVDNDKEGKNVIHSSVDVSGPIYGSKYGIDDPYTAYFASQSSISTITSFNAISFFSLAKKELRNVESGAICCVEPPPVAAADVDGDTRADTGFPLTERDRLGLRGLLPPRVISFEQQYERFRLVCQNYSGLFRRPRGMYFSAKDKGEMMSMIYNWPAQQVDMIVLTDGSRILGLGDLGVQGIGIPIGKLDMYVAAAGINPQKILPVMLDVGTNNEKLLADRLYLGLRQHRLEGDEYLAIVDELMEAVHARWPKAIVQFEDFQMKWAFETLERYRKRFCMFNDDVQGTAGVALAGLLGAVRAQGRPLTDFANQKIAVVGAGSAGLGVLKMALQAVSRMAGPHADPHFFLLDKDGLITKERKCIDPAATPFAISQGETKEFGLCEGSSLLEVIKKVKPHVLLGLSGVGGVFNEEILRAMKDSDSTKPAIFAMSNPTANAECTAEEAFKHAGENIVFASGSPFEDVDLGNGKTGHVNQANNMYLFPGIGLGSLLCGARIITDDMLQAAAECLASYITDEEIQMGILYPSIDSIRDITAEVGAAVVRAAVAEDLADGHGEVGPKDLKYMSKEQTIKYVKENMWFPVYSPLAIDQIKDRIRDLIMYIYLQLQPNEWAKGVLSSKERLTEERVDEVVQQFLNDFKDGKLEEKQWPPHLAAYKVSKAALNAYTWLAAQKYPNICINAVCPGFARTDITFNAGPLSEVEADEAPVKMALLPHGGLQVAGARDEKRGLSDYVVFHHLNVVDAASIAAAVQFLTATYGKLDILVNNAGIGGIGLEGDASIIQQIIESDVASAEPLQLKAGAALIQTYEAAEECIQTNFYGAKRVTEAFIPLLRLSDSPTIVNFSSLLGHLKNERAKTVLNNEACLTEESMCENSSTRGDWKRTSGRLMLQPIKTDITCNLWPLSAEEAAQNVVRVALLPRGGPSAAFFYKDALSVFYLMDSECACVESLKITLFMMWLRQHESPAASDAASWSRLRERPAADRRRCLSRRRSGGAAAAKREASADNGSRPKHGGSTEESTSHPRVDDAVKAGEVPNARR